MKFSFCESAHAIFFGRWHIRKLSEVGPMYGGGIDTDSLCGHVNPEIGGWDLRVEITEHHLTHACPRCVAAYQAQVKLAKTH